MGPWLLFCCCENTITKSNMGRKGSVSSYSLQSITDGSQSRNSSRNLEMGSGVETMEDCCFLATLSDLLSYFFMPTTYLPRDGTA